MAALCCGGVLMLPPFYYKGVSDEGPYRAFAQVIDAVADARQAGLDATRGVFQKFPMIAAMKAAIAWKTGRDEWCTVRPPLFELDRAQRTALEAGLQGVECRFCRPTGARNGV
jgi:dihydrodipicolinate synthase/N-acetylneuraminate lyase